jgi:hypothetical protein
MTLAVIILSAAMFQFSANGQGPNVADLSGFTAYETADINGWTNIPVNNSFPIEWGANSAQFQNFSEPPPYSLETLTGNISTVPNTTYDISFTAQFEGNGDIAGSLDLTFGSTELSWYTPQQPDSYDPTNFDFTIVSTSATTPLTFFVTLDSGINLDVSNFSIIAVPEISAFSLFLCGGCVLLLGRRLRNSSRRMGWHQRRGVNHS